MTQQSNNPVNLNSSPLTIHFIGIGGCGMNGIAQLAAHAGHRVSGSDRTTCPELFRSLENLGIKIFQQDGSGITKDTDLVVYSTAIEPGNPDIQQSKTLTLPLLHRAEMLAKLCENKEVIAVAGTAGKSTVTGLLGWIFQYLGKDPTVYCGAPVLNWKNTPPNCRAETIDPLLATPERNSPVPTLQKFSDITTGNVRFGTGPWIIEADESDQSFLNFYPDHAIITNIAEDHFELEELHQLFEMFESQVSGTLIKPIPPRRSGPPPGRGLRSCSDFLPMERWPKAGEGSSLIGKHNTENLHNALRLCQALGLDMHKCIEAVASFKVIERRLERHGNKVIDDFAHSPIKIEAALESVSTIWPAFNAVWRPHGFTPLAQGLDGFIQAFSSKKAKNAFILPVYYAGGSVNRKITSEQLVEKLQAAGVTAELVPDYQRLTEKLVEQNLPVLIMGARDPELPKFANRIVDLSGDHL